MLHICTYMLHIRRLGRMAHDTSAADATPAREVLLLGIPMLGWLACGCGARVAANEQARGSARTDNLH